MSNIHLKCTALVGINKTGVLKPDEDGYYTVVLGALDFRNSSGAEYPAKGAQLIIDKSSALHRRIKAGNVRGEYGHPKMEEGMSEAAWFRRILTTEETRICCHTSEVWVDYNFVYKGKTITAIMGKVRPCGPYGPALKDQFENPKENVAFSIRSLTQDVYERGVLMKYIVDIEGWDYVNEPGLEVAQKSNAPSLESYEDVVISPELLARTASSMHNQTGAGLESNNGAVRAITAINQRTRVKHSTNRPASAKW